MIIAEILLPTPTKESLCFWFGALVVSQLLKIDAPDAQSDFAKSQSYYWLIGPLGFIVAAAAVYKQGSVYNHWFFGSHELMWIAKYIVDLLFGIALGLAITSGHFLARGNLLIEKLFTWIKKIRLWCTWVIEETKSLLRLIPQVRVMPDLWDRFKPESQINVLETFLKEIENVRDRKSLELWRARQSDTEENGFNFRISLGKQSLSKLDFKEIKSKDYLAIEFWKAKDDDFRIRTTDQSLGDPKEFHDATTGQREELMPHIKYWYSKLR